MVRAACSDSAAARSGAVRGGCDVLVLLVATGAAMAFSPRYDNVDKRHSWTPRIRRCGTPNDESYAARARRPTSFSALGPAAIVRSCSGVQARVSFLRRQQSPGPVAPVRSGGRTLSPRPRLPARRSSASTALVERAGVPRQRLRHERSNPALAPRRSVLEPVRLRSMQRGGPYAPTAVHCCTQGARSTPAQPGRASPSWTRPTRAGQDAADRRRASRSSATTSSWRTR